MEHAPWIIEALKETGRYTEVVFDPNHHEIDSHQINSMTLTSPSGEKATVVFFAIGSHCIIVGVRMIGQING